LSYFCLPIWLIYIWKLMEWNWEIEQAANVNMSLLCWEIKSLHRKKECQVCWAWWHTPGIPALSRGISNLRPAWAIFERPSFNKQPTPPKQEPNPQIKLNNRNEWQVYIKMLNSSRNMLTENLKSLFLFSPLPLQEVSCRSWFWLSSGSL
jgi:hypothetical protein